MAKRFTEQDDALLAELGVEAEVVKTSIYTPREERIIAGFEEIQRFVEKQGRLPEHGEDRGIFERLYAVRLDRIRSSNECTELLETLDTEGLLNQEPEGNAMQPSIEEATDEELLEALGVEADATADVTQLKHVRSRAEIRAAEEVAQRISGDDFESFRPIFEQVQHELTSGDRRTTKYQDNAEVRRGDLFILDGQKVLIDRMGEEFVADHGRKDRRLRVIYDNGTESDLLLRSLQRSLNKDSNSRRILPSDFVAPPLFSDQEEKDDSQSGYIYVLRSLSDHPFIVENRNVIHKIGVTGGDIERRVSNAKKDPTFLMSDVELVESYKLANINRNKLEQLLHHFFVNVRMDVQLRDRFGDSVEPREWFLVPLPIIQEVMRLLIDGQLDHYMYDSDSAQLIDTKKPRS